MRTLETERLLLRPWRDDDVPQWVEMGADPRVMQFFPSTYDAEHATEMAARLRERLEADGYGWWVLEAKNVAPFVGVIALQRVPFEAAFTPAFEVGWRLLPAYWGRGYATEGAARAARFALDVLGLEEVVAMTAAQNVPSQRVMQRLGMTHDPRDDFDHPRLEASHPLRRHVLWRLKPNEMLPGRAAASKDQANVRLERPSPALADSFAAMRDAFVAAGDDQWTGVEALAHRDPVAYAALLCGWSEGRNLPPGWTPADAFWIVEGDAVVGHVDVRHPLTPQLERIGGHIGYYVHPAHRNRGIATFALREALKVLAAKGVPEALVTCAHSNAASIRVIEKCGGRRIEDSARRRYRIPVRNARP